MLLSVKKTVAPHNNIRTDTSTDALHGKSLPKIRISKSSCNKACYAAAIFLVVGLAIGLRTISEQKVRNILLEKISFERVPDIHDALLESGKEWFAEEMIPKPDLSIEELEILTKDLLNRWENDEFYMFNIFDRSTDQAVGFTFLNHVNRQYQMANLGYVVRTSRVGEGIATEMARCVAKYGFEKLGFQRIEIVVPTNNLASLKVAEKTGAAREGLLRNRLYLHGAPSDAYMYSLIPSDFGIHKTA